MVWLLRLKLLLLVLINDLLQLTLIVWNQLVTVVDHILLHWKTWNHSLQLLFTIRWNWLMTRHVYIIIWVHLLISLPLIYLIITKSRIVSLVLNIDDTSWSIVTKHITSILNDVKVVMYSKLLFWVLFNLYDNLWTLMNVYIIYLCPWLLLLLLYLLLLLRILNDLLIL